MEKVLITGAGGFIGRHIVEAALKNLHWEIHVIVSGKHLHSFPPVVHVHTADLSDLFACECAMREIMPDSMLHLAWGLADHDFLQSDSNLEWLEISLRLLRTFQKYGGRRFVFSGSSAEYGYSQSVCAEAGAAIPTDLYGICKLGFTKLGAAFCERHHIQFACIRYFSVYGPGEGHLLHAIPVAIDQMLRGRQFICKAPNNVWDYVYIDDATEATVKVMQSDFCGVVNVGGTAITMRELFAIIAGLIGDQDLLEFENERMPGKRLTADTSVLRKKIGFANQTDIRTGLARTVEWWRTRKENR